MKGRDVRDVETEALPRSFAENIRGTSEVSIVRRGGVYSEEVVDSNGYVRDCGDSLLVIFQRSMEKS